METRNRGRRGPRRRVAGRHGVAALLLGVSVLGVPHARAEWPLALDVLPRFERPRPPAVVATPPAAAAATAHAVGLPPATSEAWALCDEAVAAAERVEALPEGLLAAIARVETGRRHPSGAVLPWPWSVNAAGEGRFFASREEAEAHVRLLQARGVRSIDVGCLQVNLAHHPFAFADLAEAFSPRDNALYAARFLRALQARHGDWGVAVAHYHSATPEFGGAYRARVSAAWRAAGGPGLAATTDHAGAASAAAQGWGVVAVGPPGARLRLAPLLVPGATGAAKAGQGVSPGPRLAVEDVRARLIEEALRRHLP